MRSIKIIFDLASQLLMTAVTMKMMMMKIAFYWVCTVVKCSSRTLTENTFIWSLFDRNCAVYSSGVLLCPSFIVSVFLDEETETHKGEAFCPGWRAKPKANYTSVSFQSQFLCMTSLDKNKSLLKRPHCFYVKSKLMDQGLLHWWWDHSSPSSPAPLLKLDKGYWKPGRSCFPGDLSNQYVPVILGWPKNLFGFSITSYRKPEWPFWPIQYCQTHLINNLSIHHK